MTTYTELTQSPIIYTGNTIIITRKHMHVFVIIQHRIKYNQSLKIIFSSFSCHLQRLTIIPPLLEYYPHIKWLDSSSQLSHLLRNLKLTARKQTAKLQCLWKLLLLQKRCNALLNHIKLSLYTRALKTASHSYSAPGFTRSE